jgi:DNA-binding response OmpR family regulator
MDPNTTWISKTALEHNGFEVQTFESPILALDNFKPRLYNLLLVDIKMRDIDGSNFMMK